ncbi:MAG: hypothetical protein CMH83_20175 [Nocardioides sp.]|nr:hypothetical protein [Nocardioides sp.]
MSDLPAPGLLEPVPARTALLLRRAVCRLLDEPAGVRRAVHVGVPHEVWQTVEDSPADDGLRVDVLHACLTRLTPYDGRAPEALVWLTRAGAMEPEDDDLAWASAAWTVAAESARRLPMAVVTPQGWFDPRTGTSRTWARTRRR